MLREAEEALDGGRLAEAKEILGRLIKACPDFIGEEGPWGLLARLHAVGQETEHEREALEEWARRSDSAVGVYERLMEIAETGADWPAVRTNAQRYLEVDPLVAPPYRYLARAADELGDVGEAVGAYESLLQLDPPNPADLHYQLARLMAETQRAKAKRHLLQSLEDAPRNRAGLDLLVRLSGDVSGGAEGEAKAGGLDLMERSGEGGIEEGVPPSAAPTIGESEGEEAEAAPVTEPRGEGGER
jgi:tetratricopeptide (TPR) repeat protein